jgi:adenylate cyclase class 2
MSASPIETEIKLRVPEGENAHSLIERHGFRIARERVFEANTIYDTSGGRLRAAGELLRLRQTGAGGLLTFKGRGEPGRYKARPEIETEVADPAATARILEAAGFRPVFRYEKYRTEFDRSDANGSVVFDETPIGIYLELEGEPQWIDAVAAELGFHDSDYITASYGKLYVDHCRAVNKPPGDMVFPAKASDADSPPRPEQ